MKSKSKMAIAGMLFAISLSTVDVGLSAYQTSVSANAYKVKSHKHNTKKSNKHTLKIQLTKDVNDYNQAVKQLDYPINANSNVEYTLVSPYYSQTYYGMAKSLHAMAHDMSINSVDPYDGGTSGIIGGQPVNLDELANAGIQIYGMFSSRLKSKMSSSEFKKLSNMRDTVQSNESQIDKYSNNNELHTTDNIIITQWKNIQSLFNMLGDNVSKLK